MIENLYTQPVLIICCGSSFALGIIAGALITARITAKYMARIVDLIGEIEADDER